MAQGENSLPEVAVSVAVCVSVVGQIWECFGLSRTTQRVAYELA